jgi:hypothetical protein
MRHIQRLPAAKVRREVPSNHRPQLDRTVRTQLSCTSDIRIATCGHQPSINMQKPFFETIKLTMACIGKKYVIVI